MNTYTVPLIQQRDSIEKICYDTIHTVDGEFVEFRLDSIKDVLSYPDRCLVQYKDRTKKIYPIPYSWVRHLQYKDNKVKPS